jgi:hypothetical protein
MDLEAVRGQIGKAKNVGIRYRSVPQTIQSPTSTLSAP